MKHKLNTEDLHNYACDIADYEPRAARMLAQCAKEIQELRFALATQTLANNKGFNFDVITEVQQ